MMRVALVCLLPILLISTNVLGGTNVLLNAGFETEGSSSDKALNWEWWNPDQHGSTWGVAYRKDWHAHSGSWGGVIAGTWAGGDNGGWWQERQAIPGATYTFSAWFWADNSWTNQSDQGIKIEFFSGVGRGETYISQVYTTFQGVGESWVQKSVSGVCPTNATWVRIVTWANSVGSDGALQFDDFSLVVEPGTLILLSEALQERKLFESRISIFNYPG